MIYCILKSISTENDLFSHPTNEKFIAEEFKYRFFLSNISLQTRIAISCSLKNNKLSSLPCTSHTLSEPPFLRAFQIFFFILCPLSPLFRHIFWNEALVPSREIRVSECKRALLWDDWRTIEKEINWTFIRFYMHTHTRKFFVSEKKKSFYFPWRHTKR